MGKFGSPQIGVFSPDGNDYDNPSMNRCPNCGAYFSCDVCPICKTVCPDEMKAGRRKMQKRAKIRSRRKGVKLGALFVWIAIFAVAIGGGIWYLSGNHFPVLMGNESAYYEPFPADGTINSFWMHTEVTNFTLINDKPDAIFVRFKQQDKCIFEVYVSANGRATYSVPPGVYSVSMASGDAMHWQGEERKFGSQTCYSQAQRLSIPSNGLELTIYNTESVFGELQPSSKHEFDQ